MSNSNFNNGKRHVRDKAYYGGIPNQKKRIKFINPNEENKKEERFLIKYNLESLLAIFVIAYGWQSENGLKYLAMFLVFIAGLSIYDKEKM